MRYPEQRAALFGRFTRAEIARICCVDRTTAARWKRGTARMPHAARRLLEIEIYGELPPSARTAWPGWRFGRDGLLYAPDLKRGFNRDDLYQLHWLQQTQSWRTARATITVRDASRTASATRARS